MNGRPAQQMNMQMDYGLTAISEFVFMNDTISVFRKTFYHDGRLVRRREQ
jgi:hypothetical protein